LPSLEAGVFWGTVGAIRELLARQSFERDQKPWIVWTGGDAERLARAVSGDDARIIPDLVLDGLVRAAFPSCAN
jgi:type III pantothenate kinase